MNLIWGIVTFESVSIVISTILLNGKHLGVTIPLIIVAGVISIWAIIPLINKFRAKFKPWAIKEKKINVAFMLVSVHLVAIAIALVNDNLDKSYVRSQLEHSECNELDSNDKEQVLLQCESYTIGGQVVPKVVILPTWKYQRYTSEMKQEKDKLDFKIPVDMR